MRMFLKRNFQIKKVILSTPIGKYEILDNLSDFIFIINVIKNKDYLNYIFTLSGNLIDIGAHIGTFSIPVGLRYKTNNLNFKIIAIEPNLRNFNSLKKI